MVTSPFPPPLIQRTLSLRSKSMSTLLPLPVVGATRMRIDEIPRTDQLSVIRRWPSREAKAWLEGLLDTIADDERVLTVVVIGSVVRDVPTSVDLDLLLIFQGDRPTLPPPPIEVDLRAYPDSAIETLLTNGHALLCWAVRFGEAIFERGGYWSDLQRHWHDRLPFPSLEKVRERATRTAELHRILIEMGDTDAAQEQLVTLLTHLAWEALILAGIFPASRPELPGQLSSIGADELAVRLSTALAERSRLELPARLSHESATTA